MDWFLYDKDIRHERVTCNVTLSLNSKADILFLFFLLFFCFFVFYFVLIFLSADYMHSSVSSLVVSALRSETKVARFGSGH